MIVVDLGSETYGQEESFLKLMEMFRPTVMYAFDPLCRNASWGFKGCRVHYLAAAAWIEGGTIELGVGADSGLNATVMREKNEVGEWTDMVTVPCVDFSEWLERLVYTGGSKPAAVKMDVEGVEYLLLEKMIADGTDRLMQPLLVEWHDHKLGDNGFYEQRRQQILESLSCEVRGW